MPDPFAAALAALHRAAGAVAAVFTPPAGAPVAIDVIRTRASEGVAFGDGTAVLDADMVRIRIADVADPTGGSLAIGAEAFTVQGAPMLDAEGLTWTCRLEPA